MLYVEGFSQHGHGAAHLALPPAELPRIELYVVVTCQSLLSRPRNLSLSPILSSIFRCLNGASTRWRRLPGNLRRLPRVRPSCRSPVTPGEISPALPRRALRENPHLRVVAPRRGPSTISLTTHRTSALDLSMPPTRFSRWRRLPWASAFTSSIRRRRVIHLVHCP